MASVHDVAAYILSKRGPMSAMKLQKLAYYAQAWSLVWDEAPLFPEPIEAWANGPVIRALYEEHRGSFTLGRDWPSGDARKLSTVQRDSVDRVLAFYGDRTAHWLSDLSHSERPWVEARNGLAPGERGDRVISLEAMADYYAGLTSVQ